MSFLKKSRQLIAALVLILVLTTATACSGAAARDTTQLPPAGISQLYTQLERGNTAAGQTYGDWVVQTGQGLIKDAYVRDNNKLGIVITPQVKPNDVRPLARSLTQGFQRKFPNQDVTILMYAPDKKLILSAQYDQQSKQIRYQ